MKNIIQNLSDHYDPDHDAIPGAPDVTWADSQLLTLIEDLYSKVEHLEDAKAKGAIAQNIVFLRQTIGSLMWLDVLTNEEFCLIQEEIVAVFLEHSRKFRGESCG